MSIKRKAGYEVVPVGDEVIALAVTLVLINYAKLLILQWFINLIFRVVVVSAAMPGHHYFASDNASPPSLFFPNKLGVLGKVLTLNQLLRMHL